MELDRPVAPDPYDLLPATASFSLTSADFADGDTLPEAHAMSGAGTSPALTWSGAPDGTRSYLVTCFDPDAPTPSGFWHWFVAGVPAEVTSLPAAATAGAGLPAGSFELRNDYGENGFGPAGPPPGDRAHRYMFAVTALGADVADLGLDADTPPAKACFLTLEHVLGRAVLTGTYAID